MTDLSRRVGSAATLLLVRRLWGAVASLAVLAYLARVLPADDFGLLAFSQAVIAILGVLATSGLAEYVIYYRGPEEDQVRRTVLWIGLLATLGLALVFVVVSFVVPAVREQTDFRYVCYLLLAQTTLSAVGAVPRAVLRRDLDLGRLVRVDLVVTTLANVAKVGLAWGGAGVYSLVIPAVGASLVSAPILLRIARVGIAPPTDWSHVRACLVYTRHVLAQRVIGIFVSRSDALIVGGLFGAVLLGTYHIALQYLTLVLTYAMGLVMSLAMPVLSEARGNLSELRRRHLRGTQLVAGFAIPVVVFQVAFVEDLLPLVFGPSWADAPLLVAIAAPSVLLRSISSPSSALYLATGKPRIGTVASVLHAVLLVIVTASTWSLGAYALIGSICAVHFLASCFHIVVGARLVQTPVHEVLSSFAPALAASVLGALGARGLMALGMPWPVGVVVGPLLGLVVCRGLWPAWLARFLQLVDRMVPAVLQGRLLRVMRLSAPSA